MTGAASKGSTLVLGHRGSPREATENTLRSFELALRTGADGVELDVQRSRDGRAVVVHDPDLERTFGVRGIVAGLDWPALERLTGARLPSFEQAASWAASAGARLNVELKAGGVEEEVLSTLERMDLLSRSFLSSFDASIVRRFGELEPRANRFLLSEQWDEEVRAQLRATGAGGVCLHVDAATPTALAQLGREGVPVVAWTVNDPLRARELLEAGVYAIITDDPAMAVRERAALAGE